MHSSAEVQLKQSLAKGEPAAFESLFKTYFQMLAVFAKKMVGDLETAEDMVQEVFIKLYDKKDSLHLHGSLKSFLFQSVRNKCLDHLRSQQSKQGHHDYIKDTAETLDFDPADLMEQTELEHKIYQVIAELPEQCQLIFKMNRFDGKKNQEIADELSISKRTVETQISKALKRLKTEVFDYLQVLVILFIYFFQKYF